MRTTAIRALVLGGGILLGGCGAGENEGFGDKTDCEKCPGSGTGPTGSGSGSGSGSGGGGGGFEFSIEGTLVRLSDPTFEDGAAFSGDFEVSLPGADGKAVVAAVDDLGQFALQDVEKGVSWAYVRQKSPTSSTALSTYSRVTVPSGSSVELPVIDRSVFEEVLAQLLTPIAFEPDGAQLVLRFVRGGAPLLGVSLGVPINDSLLLYDAGEGAFASDEMATSGDGTILILNVPVEGTSRDLVIRDPDAKETTITVPVVEGGVTFGTFSL